jgi:gamma-glutamylcyclotransferase (GGCT)/AIG2-like uncharacterized protein YtfP
MLFFFYGSLLPEQLPGAMAMMAPLMSSLGAATVRGRMYDLGTHPGGIFDNSADGDIHGEVFQLPDQEDLLERLDSYEGYDPDQPESSFFVRREIPVHLGNGRIVSCWLYQYNGDPTALGRIAHGSFRKHLAERSG